METIVVTRHATLVEHLVQVGLVPPGTKVISHASEEAVRGKHVVGILPLQLAALAGRVTVVPMRVPPELRGQELTLEQVREFAGQPQTFVVTGV
jgi:hypothetical protein